MTITVSDYPSDPQACDGGPRVKITVHMVCNGDTCDREKIDCAGSTADFTFGCGQCRWKAGVTGSCNGQNVNWGQVASGSGNCTPPPSCKGNTTAGCS